MSSKQNIIYIYFKGKHLITSKSQYQYNHGQFLYFADLNLSQAFEVHFSNKDKGDSKTQIGSNKLVEIPDEYFWNGALMIYAWIYLHSETTDGETVYEVRIPLIKRAKPTDEEPLPQQQGTIDRAIAELNNAIETTTENANKTEADKTIVANIKEDVISLKEDIDNTATTVSQKAQEAIDASERAEDSAQNAAQYESNALNYSQQAEQSAQQALESKNIATQKAEVATNASSEALGYRDEALEAKNQAVQAKQNIVDYRDETKGYRDETLTIKNNVQTLKSQIDETAEEIEDISDSIKEDAQSASQSASSASQSSTNASQSASQAKKSANDAEESANQAEQNKNQTETFKNQSEEYKTQAETLKNQAEQFKNQSETNVSHYPKIVNDYWYVWDATNGEYINTNVYANGIKGDTGNGISSAVLNNDYTLTLTFTDGTTYTTSSIRGEKGEQGDPASSMDIHICSSSEYDSQTRIPTIAQPDSKTFYLVPTSDGTSPDLFTEWVYVNNAWEMFGSMKIDLSGYLTDVTLNGTSIVTDGIAEIPVMNGSTLGVAKIDTSLGIGKSSNNSLQTNPATEIELKGGTVSYKPIVPMEQHFSTFYGLAKVAGHDEKDSTLPVGQYTDEAKTSIQNMLGITDKYTSKEWIAESETELVTNAHNIGDLFYIGGTLYKVITDLNAGDVINVGVNVEVVNVNDVLNDYATKEDIENNVSIVEKSASGAVASFTDGADDLPLKSLIVDINPVQDLHGQDAPYPAGGGANKWDEQWETGWIGWSGQNADNPDEIRSKGFIPVSEGSVYRVVTSNNLQFFYYDSNKSFVSYELSSRADQSTITIPTGCAYIRFYTYGPSYGGTYKNDIAINYPSTVTTYSPYENLCPISGWTQVGVEQRGKNLLSPNYSAYQTNYNYLYINGAIPEGQIARLTFIDKDTSVDVSDAYIGFQEGLSQSATTTPNYIWAVNGGVIQNNMTNVTLRGVICSGVFIYPKTQETFDAIFSRWNVMVELGSTATDYEPYTGRSITINLGQTVYGGKLDVLSGELVIDRAMVDLGTLNWNYEPNYNRHGANFNQIPNIKIPESTIVPNALCSKYKIVSSATGWANRYTVTAMAFDATYLRVYNDGTADAATYKIAMSGVQLVYELATPIVYHLSPTEVQSILGQNHVWADTGNTSCEYFSQVDEDLTDYIDINLKSYAKKSELPTIPVSDVQLNGNSIVNNGTANIPIGNSETYGVFKTNSANGIFSNNGALAINNASESDIKTGTEELKPLTPNREHMAVFYGLAKVAGDTTQSQSNNAVGTYTDEAKTAIKTMLGVHDTYDSFIEEVTGTDPVITGQPSYRYNCGEVYSLTITPPSSGTIDFRFTSGSTPTVLTLPSTVKMPEWWVEVEANTIYEMCITDGIYCGVMSWAMT